MKDKEKGGKNIGNILDDDFFQGLQKGPIIDL